MIDCNSNKLYRLVFLHFHFSQSLALSMCLCLSRGSIQSSRLTHISNSKHTLLLHSAVV